MKCMHPIRIQFLQPYKIFQLLNIAREGGKVLIFTPCFRNGITIKVQFCKLSLIVKILFLPQSVFKNRLYSMRIHSCNGKKFLTKILEKKHF